MLICASQHLDPDVQQTRRQKIGLNYCTTKSNEFEELRIIDFRSVCYFYSAFNGKSFFSTEREHAPSRYYIDFVKNLHAAVRS